MRGTHPAARGGAAVPGGGQHGHTDRASGITGGSTAVNYLFDSERGCGRCHVGKYLPGSLGEIDLATGQPTPTMALVRDGVDCLVCHAAQYDGREGIFHRISLVESVTLLAGAPGSVAILRAGRG